MLIVTERFKEIIKPVEVKFLSGTYEGDRAEFFFARDVEAAIDTAGRHEFGRASGVSVVRKRIAFPKMPSGRWLAAEWGMIETNCG